MPLGFVKKWTEGISLSEIVMLVWRMILLIFLLISISSADLSSLHLLLTFALSIREMSFAEYAFQPSTTLNSKDFASISAASEDVKPYGRIVILKRFVRPFSVNLKVCLISSNST